MLDFLLSLKQFALVIVFFACSNAHLMLDIAEIEALLLHLLLDSNKFLSLLVKLSLHLVKI